MLKSDILSGTRLPPSCVILNFHFIINYFVNNVVIVSKGHKSPFGIKLSLIGSLFSLHAFKKKTTTRLIPVFSPPTAS